MNKEISDLVTFVISYPICGVITFGICYLTDDFTKNPFKYINSLKKISDNYSKYYFNSIPNFKYHKDLKIK